MDKNTLNRVFAAALWAIAVALWAALGFWYLAAGLFLLHFVEIFVAGLKVGRRSGKSILVSVILTLVFGYTWWLPLKKSQEAAG
ncbi:MAG: hypothetical protein Q8M76_02070 [Spirochaetaceae bacterium]|nr:hypothetical protein [Spirochaetaceae bacterium]